MFSFLRTLRSARLARQSAIPTLRFYKVSLLPGRAQRYGVPVVGLATTGFLLLNHTRDGSLDRIITDKPLHLPIGFVQKVAPVPYQVGCPEVKSYREFASDKHRRVQAEIAILTMVRRSVDGSKVQLGHFEGYASPFWMTFGLAPPPHQFTRKYLAISLTGIQVVTKPVHPTNVARLSASFYPNALAHSFFSFGQSLYNSFFSILKADEPLGKYKPPTLQRPQSSSNSTKLGNGEQDVPLLPSGAVMAFNEAFTNGMNTLQQEWNKDRNKTRPQPPRGWVLADGTIRLVGSELVLVVDFQAAINPKNLDQGFVYNLKARHHTRRHRGMFIRTFQQPTVPPDPPNPQQQQQPQQQQAPSQQQQPPPPPPSPQQQPQQPQQTQSKR